MVFISSAVRLASLPPLRTLHTKPTRCLHFETFGWQRGGNWELALLPAAGRSDACVMLSWLRVTPVISTWTWRTPGLASWQPQQQFKNVFCGGSHIILFTFTFKKDENVDRKVDTWLVSIGSLLSLAWSAREVESLAQLVKWRRTHNSVKGKSHPSYEDIQRPLRLFRPQMVSETRPSIKSFFRPHGSKKKLTPRKWSMTQE